MLICSNNAVHGFLRKATVILVPLVTVLLLGCFVSRFRPNLRRLNRLPLRLPPRPGSHLRRLLSVASSLLFRCGWWLSGFRPYGSGRSRDRELKLPTYTLFFRMNGETRAMSVGG
jgi:hypothetical protein